MKNSLFAILIAMLFVKGAVAGADWGTDFTAACTQAKATGRPILVDFTGSDWCGWCIKLDKEVFSQAAFKAYAKDNVVLLMLDFPHGKPQTAAVKKQNEKLSAKYGIEGFPTILLLDAEGKELARTGYQKGGAEAYVEHLKKLLKDVPRSAANGKP